MDGTAYLAADTCGLVIVDVSNATAPATLGAVATAAARDVQVIGTYAYLADRTSGLQIFDVSNTSAPTIVGTLATPGHAQAVSIVGNMAYVGDGANGLLGVDVSNPAAPRLLSSYDTAGNAQHFDVVDGLAYVGDGSGGLQVLQVNGTLIHNISYFANNSDVKIAGNYAYVANDGSTGAAHRGLYIFDISNPTAPVQRAYYQTAGNAHSVEVLGNRAYVAEGTYLRVFDISNPTVTPVLLASLNLGATITELTLSGSTMYVAYSSGNGGRHGDRGYHHPDHADANLDLRRGHPRVPGTSRRQHRLSRGRQRWVGPRRCDHRGSPGGAGCLAADRCTRFAGRRQLCLRDRPGQRLCASLMLRISARRCWLARTTRRAWQPA